MMDECEGSGSGSQATDSVAGDMYAPEELLPEVLLRSEVSSEASTPPPPLIERVPEPVSPDDDSDDDPLYKFIADGEIFRTPTAEPVSLGPRISAEQKVVGEKQFASRSTAPLWVAKWMGVSLAATKLAVDFAPHWDPSTTPPTRLGRRSLPRSRTSGGQLFAARTKPGSCCDAQQQIRKSVPGSAHIAF